MAPLPAVIVIIIAGAIIGGTAALVLRARRRQADEHDSLEALALRLALSYQPNADDAFRQAWSVLPQIPTRATGAKADQLIFGTLADAETIGAEPIEVTAFRHQHMTLAGQTPVQIVQWIISTDVPDAWATILIKPRAGILRLFGGRSRVLAEDPEFDRAFVIRTDDPRFAAALLTPAVRDVIRAANDPWSAGPGRTPRMWTAPSWVITHAKLCIVVAHALKPAQIEIGLAHLAAMHNALAEPAARHAQADNDPPVS